jgi:hypothetical protein
MTARLRRLLTLPSLLLMTSLVPAAAGAGAPRPTGADCLRAWNQAPSSLRLATAKRHLPDTPTQLVAGDLNGADPGCGVVFATSRNFLLVATGRWTKGKVVAWTTRRASGGEAAQLVRPREVVSVVFDADGRFSRFAAPRPPTASACERAWNARPPEARLVLARKHPRRIVVGPGVLSGVRNGVLRDASGTGCRIAYLVPDGHFGLVFGHWKDGRVTTWVTPREIPGPTEAAAMAAGHANATIRADGTIHVFS